MLTKSRSIAPSGCRGTRWAQRSIRTAADPGTRERYQSPQVDVPERSRNSCFTRHSQEASAATQCPRETALGYYVGTELDPGPHQSAAARQPDTPCTLFTVTTSRPSAGVSTPAASRLPPSSLCSGQTIKHRIPSEAPPAQPAHASSGCCISPSAESTTTCSDDRAAATTAPETQGARRSEGHLVAFLPATAATREGPLPKNPMRSTGNLSSQARGTRSEGN